MSENTTHNNTIEKSTTTIEDNTETSKQKNELLNTETDVKTPQNVKDGGNTILKEGDAKTEGNTEIDRSQYVHYEGDIAIYTDPQSRQQYTWDKETNEWKLRKIDYEFDGSNYFYTDEKTSIKYKWDTATNGWIENDSKNTEKTKENEEGEEDDEEEEYDENNAQKTALSVKRQDMSKGTYGYEGDTHTYTDATDGTVYIWDKEKNAWFPKVDEDFLARYQMSYGFTDPTASENTTSSSGEKPEPSSTTASVPEVNPNIVEDDKATQKRKAEPPKWFDVGNESTKVYVSNLPLELTEQEFVDVMQKCGLVMKDLDNSQMKVKLYTDPHTKQFKGDALCTYIKKESVPLALNILDGYEFKGKKIKVERAKFTMKGDSYDPSLKPKKRRKKDLEKLKKMQEKLFDWRPDKLRGERSKNENVIVVKNLFDPTLFDKDVTLILEYQQDLREECAKCGHVRKVVLYDKHPEGVAQIYFKEAEAADACKELLNNRWFGQRKITAETWDGKTKYKINETTEEKEARLKKWETYLEEEDKKKKEGEKKDKEDEEEEDGGSDDTRSSGESGTED